LENPKSLCFLFLFDKKVVLLQRYLMKMRTKGLLQIIVCLCFLWLLLPKEMMAEGKDFVVVIDAGHGGKDPGAVGKKAQEKKINLDVALELGRLINANCKDVKVVYTRSTDVFVSLDRRAKIANEAKADLFISIHTNALPKGRIARGTETYTLGMARADDNLEVAKRENSVILVEENYEERYAGFNPKSSESYIMFEFMQDKHMEHSVSLARLIQGQFKSYAGRVDKGVHQAGFLVLRDTSMPSVLVELGFISTPDEEAYMSSKKGVAALSRSIYNAFAAYKKARVVAVATSSQASSGNTPKMKVQQATPESAPAKKEVKTQETVTSQRPIFKVQLLSTSTKLPAGSSKLKGVKANYYEENGMYKYTTGNTEDYNEILRLKRQVEKNFKGAFIVAFRGGKKMDVQEAIREFKSKK
jgi:N-acetylmuramoyl-L-alanine amidase